MPYDKPHVTPAGMKSHGWTKAAIKRFLGGADDYAPNPHYRSGSEMRLYKTDRVLAFEQTDQFKRWLESKVKRKANVAAIGRVELAA